MIIQFVYNYENIRGLPKVYRYECRKLLELARASQQPLVKIRVSVYIFEKINIQEVSKPLQEFFNLAMEDIHVWPGKESTREESMKQLGNCSWVVNLVEE